jgi:uncharacterized phage protein gp47/JayE
MITLPTLTELKDSIINSIETTFNTTLPTFGKNFLRGMSDVQAGKLWLLYKSVAFTQKNIFIDTADPESMGGTLERFGRIKLGRNPFSAIAGVYKVSVTGEIGGVIAASTTFKSDDNSSNPGFLFVLDNQFTFVATSGIITLRALTPGLDSELEAGDTLTATIPIALVDEQGVLFSIGTAPQSAEDIEEYRQKGIEAYRLEAQGGAGSDYRLWSFDAQGVKTSYPYAVSGNNNEVNLYIEANITDSVDGKGTPTGAILTAVEEAIEDPTVSRPSRKPLAVFDVHYLPVQVREIDIDIYSYSGITPAIESSILATITDFLSDVRPFVSSIDVLANQNDIFDINNIISLILQAVPGSSFGSVILRVDSVPVTSFQFLGGDIPHLNNITYP